MELVIGLIGVAVGAFITGFFNLRLERHRERTLASRERHQSEEEAFAAARLLRVDVEAAHEAVARALEDEPPSWPIALDPDWTRSWGAYRRVMAAELDDAEFDAVAAAFVSVEQLERAFKTGRDPNERALKDSDTKFLEDSKRTLAPALEALRKHAHRPAPNGSA